MSGALLMLTGLTVLGMLVWSAVLGWPRDAGGRLLAVGEGYLLGVLLVGNGLWLAGPIATAGLAGRILPWLILAGIGCGVLGWRGRAAAGTASVTDHAQRRRVLAAMIALLLVGGLILLQVAALPTLTWDAWNAWLAKSKAWYFAGSFLDVVDLNSWLQRPSDPVLSVVAAHYPQSLPRVGTLLASAAGEWNDRAVQLAWPLLWAALGAQLAGALLRHGTRSDVAAGAAVFLLTVPLVTAHASLGGYADLWLAAAVLAVGQHGVAYARSGSWRSLAACLLFALLLPTIKLEGAVWAVCLLLPCLAWRLPPVWRWTTASVLLVAAFGMLTISGELRLPLPGIGQMAFEWGAVTVPMLGRMSLVWREVGGTVAQSLFLLPNWSLLWFLLLPVVLLCRRALAAPELAMLGMSLLTGGGFLFVLFFFTDAAAWAEDLTSLNRLLLHLVPLLVLWLALLLSARFDRPAIRGRWL